MEKQIIRIWHHNDNDGRLAAFIAARGLLRVYEDADVLFFEMDYSKKPDLSKVGASDVCVIVDFSFDADTMKALLAITENVTWIDHHATAIEALKDVTRADGSYIMGCRRTEDSATLLAWQYFNSDTVPVPDVVVLVDVYDAWKHKQGNGMAFLYASAMECTDPSLPDHLNLWAGAIDRPSTVLGRVILNGHAIQRYAESSLADRLKRYSWIGRMEGYDADILCLSGVRGSKSFESAEDRTAVLCAYEHAGDKFTVSLYSDQGVDVSVLCKLHGGGGHKGAAGFICKELPIKFVRKYGG